MNIMSSPEKTPQSSTTPESQSKSQSQVPTDYVNPCNVCEDVFCSQECEDSHARITGNTLDTDQNQTVDMQYETDSHPMSKYMYDSLSQVRGFTSMNGATYEAYVANWEIRRQSGCAGN